MDGVLLSFKRIASLANLGESRARTLRDRYEKAVPVTGEGRSRKYPKEAASVLALADKLEKAGKKAQEVMADLLARSSSSLSSTVDKESLSRIMELIEGLSREVSELKSRDLWSRGEIKRLNREVRFLKGQIHSLSERKSGLEELWDSFIKFIEDLLDF